MRNRLSRFVGDQREHQPDKDDASKRITSVFLFDALGNVTATDVIGEHPTTPTTTITNSATALAAARPLLRTSAPIS